MPEMPSQMCGGENPLLVRAKLFVKTGDFDKAVQYCERVLDAEPRNGEAYFCRLMAERQVSDEAKLADRLDILDDKTFKLAEEFADPQLGQKLAELKRRYANNLQEMLARKAAREKAARERQAQLEREEAERQARLKREREEKEAQRKRELAEQQKYEENERRKAQFQKTSKWVLYFFISAVIVGVSIFTRGEFAGIGAMVVIILSLIKPFFFGSMLVSFGILFALGNNVTGLDFAPLLKPIIGGLMIFFGVRSSRDAEDYSKISLDTFFPFLLFSVLGASCFLGVSFWLVKGILATVLLIVAGFAL